MSDVNGVRRVHPILCGLLVVGAVAGGLGLSRGSAATAQPTAFELEHSRILSYVGTFEGDVSLGRKKFVPSGGGYGGYKNGYYIFEELGTAHLAIEASDQRGKTVTFSSASIGSYGGGYKVEPRATITSDSATGRRAGKAVLRYRKRRVRDEYGHFQTVEQVDWSSATRMDKGTRVTLKGSTSLEYGTFDFGGSSSVSGGATRGLAGGKPKVLLQGFQIASGGGTLHGDITWTSETGGTVDFTAPPFLEGKSGTIRALAGGKYQVKGPKGYPVKINFDEEGNGRVDLGLGSFAVQSDYGGFVVTFE